MIRNKAIGSLLKKGIVPVVEGFLLPLCSLWYIDKTSGRIYAIWIHHALSWRDDVDYRYTRLRHPSVVVFDRRHRLCPWDTVWNCSGRIKKQGSFVLEAALVLFFFSWTKNVRSSFLSHSIQHLFHVRRMQICRIQVSGVLFPRMPERRISHSKDSGRYKMILLGRCSNKRWISIY